MDHDLDQHLAKISRGLFINRCILIFIAMCVGIILFLPSLAASIAEISNRLVEMGGPHLTSVLGAILGISAVIGVAAFVVSQVYPSAPKPKEPAEY